MVPPPPPVMPDVAIQADVAQVKIPEVPFYSQFTDIASPRWQEVGCGITSLAMVIDYYKPNAVSVNSLLKQGIAAGAYSKKYGWTTSGLIALSQKYGLNADFYDLSTFDGQTALTQMKTLLQSGPVMVSVHNRFNSKSKVPHIVVVNAMDNNVVYYNDPAAKTGDKQISITNFLKGWKERLIVVRPNPEEVSNSFTKSGSS